MGNNNPDWETGAAGVGLKRLQIVQSSNHENPGRIMGAKDLTV